MRCFLIALGVMLAFSTAAPGARAGDFDVESHKSWPQLHKGMTYEEVVAAMGREPAHQSASVTYGNGAVGTFYYWTQEKPGNLHADFVDGRLSTFGGTSVGPENDWVAPPCPVGSGSAHPIAQWKLGRMYADGDGVVQDDQRAFEYFARIVNEHGEDSPSAPQASIVANAFVAIGRYYLNGIPNSKITADPKRAQEILEYAANYFNNADAQWELANLFLKPGSSRDDFTYGARWLGLAAQKGQHRAQARLGQMLFNGERLPKQPARGLMWLTLARDSAGPDETWIQESYNWAIATASEEDRAKALEMLEQWVRRRKD
jgi:exopolysaccharide production negative regulator